MSAGPRRDIDVRTVVHATVWGGAAGFLAALLVQLLIWAARPSCCGRAYQKAGGAMRLRRTPGAALAAAALAGPSEEGGAA
ncbi:MAG: hypothetical protein LBL86_07275 [Coriobacteriales bacterium]|nr:hypothetical protein [Coriobacteriales bacterium]